MGAQVVQLVHHIEVQRRHLPALFGQQLQEAFSRQPLQRRAIGERQPQALVPLVLSVGRLRAKKGLDTLIDACALLRQRGVAFGCEIVGYGEEQARLQAQIDQLGLADHVTLPGKLTAKAA